MGAFGPQPHRGVVILRCQTCKKASAVEFAPTIASPCPECRGPRGPIGGGLKLLRFTPEIAKQIIAAYEAHKNEEAEELIRQYGRREMRR